ncbi:MAG: hypothetical protein COA78_11060 [Blastopirellula sp.]|nr:MAG: hypothetical protein COA78_11060 [Blastopirellula sp.]
MDAMIRKKLFWAILFVALFIRIAAGFWWQSRMPDEQRFFFGDSASYEVLAQQIAQGKPYQHGTDRLFRTPGYPLALAPFYLIQAEPPVIWLRIGNAFWGTLAVMLAGILGARLFNERAGLWAALLVALYPGAIAMSVFVLAESVFCPLMLLQLILWHQALTSSNDKHQWICAALAGAVFAAAVLVRPSWLLFPVFVTPVGSLFFANRMRQVKTMAVMMVAAVIVFSPWWIRNYSITGRFVPTTLQIGASQYDGLSPMATGASDMSYVSEFNTEQQFADIRATGPLAGTFETRLSDRMQKASTDWARQNPGKVAELAVVKFGRMWNVWPNEESLRSWKFRVVVCVGFVPLMLLGLWGTWKYANRGFAYALCFLPAVYFTLLHMVFVSSIRYRQPALLPLAVLAAGILASFYAKTSDLGLSEQKPDYASNRD